MVENENRIILKLAELLLQEKLITPEEKSKLYILVKKEGNIGYELLSIAGVVQKKKARKTPLKNKLQKLSLV